MKVVAKFTLNIILVLQVLLLFLFLFDARIQLPVWLQVTGRLHPMILHLPIGFLIFLVALLFFKGQFKKKSFNRLVFICLLLISLSASISALLGLFLSVQGDYGAEQLQEHKLGGVVLSFLCYFILIGYAYVKKRKAILYVGTAVTVSALLYTGHSGSVLTHGENFVFAPMIKTSAKQISLETSSVYQISVEPILESKCFSCHNEGKSKGGLVMTSVDKFKQGGKKGAEWVAGNPDSSRMVQYIHLPLADDNHMPPDGKPQLTSAEIFVLESWIKSGADFEKLLAEYSDTDTLKSWVIIQGIPKKELEPENLYDFKAVSQSVIDKLNTPYCSVFPLYQNSPALQADFFIRASFKIGTLESLMEIKDQLVVLNLSKMPLGDSDLKVISQFKKLERLNLNFTNITGSGLSDLKALTKLQSLSLSGTAVDNQNVESVLSLPELKELFIWDTKVTEEQCKVWQQKYPAIKIVQRLFNDSAILQLSKPILINEGIIRQGESIQLKHSMPGVKVIYTLDGTEPDSVRGMVYEKPIAVNETVKLKAIACRVGWYCSELLTVTNFVEGFKPGRAELLTLVDKQYPGLGATSLTDGRKGFIDVLKEPAWLGFRDNNFVAGFDFGITPPTLKKIVLSYGNNMGGYLFPPTEVEVWGGKDKDHMHLLKSIKTEKPKGYEPQRVEAFGVEFKPESYSYYKIVAKPIKKLPEWHSGKGQKGWIFIDEVFFY
ncbi:MAG: chitobiase/beta-hexosaminidase C-terminal domain-containing protein [Cyclobacteriaceae bacterium]|nr:chitobiase/beta-hexosaminidase C-terminal domain-containing protein [Cyclobacteriaceae bacterium]